MVHEPKQAGAETPTGTRGGLRGVSAAVAGALVVLGAATVLDRWAFTHMLSHELIANPFRDWYWLLRLAGYWPTWLVIGAAVCLVDRSPRRGLFPVGAAALAGLAAEGLKLVIRRGRPLDTDGAYHFVPFAEHTWESSFMGLPSSHAAVAFAGAFAVARLWPRAGWVLVPLAIGCGLTRVLVGQHFLSDIAGGAIVGALACAAVVRVHAALASRAAGGPA